MDTEPIHKQVRRLIPTNRHCRMVVHALIDLGRVERLECQMPECVLGDRRFHPRREPGRGYDPHILTIDHIQTRADGGSDRPENLRLLHHACNMAATRGRVDKPETRAKKKAAAVLRSREGRYPTGEEWKQRFGNRAAGWNVATRPDDGRRAPARRNLSLSAAQVKAMRKAHRNGIKVDDIAARYGVGRSTAYSAIRGIAAYTAI